MLDSVIGIVTHSSVSLTVGSGLRMWVFPVVNNVFTTPLRIEVQIRCRAKKEDAEVCEWRVQGDLGERVRSGREINWICFSPKSRNSYCLK